MTDVGELKTRVKAMQSASSHKEIYDILVWLKRNVLATEQLLRETKAGLAVGKLRMHASKEVAELAKELVKKWKSEVDRSKLKAVTAAKPNVQVDTKATATTSGTPGTPSPATATDAVRSAETDNVPKSLIGDDVRDRCIVMLYNAICLDSGAPVDQLLRRAREIEEAVLKQNNGKTEAGYRNKIRSLYLNLKDKGNPGLRESVVSGDLHASKLPTMSSKDLASEDRKQADKKISDANFFASLGSEEMAAETDAFQCSRCKQRKTRYRQQQTRSADEPMTTFVTCTNCGNRWKFS